MIKPRKVDTLRGFFITEYYLFSILITKYYKMNYGN